MSRQRRNQDLSEFGKRVETWRKQMGISQRVLAAMIGTHQRTLSDWLTSDGMPGAVHQVARLSAMMGSPIHDLLAGDVDLAPLRDPAQVRDVLARMASDNVLKRYLEGVETQADGA